MIEKKSNQTAESKQTNKQYLKIFYQNTAEREINSRKFLF